MVLLLSPTPAKRRHPNKHSESFRSPLSPSFGARSFRCYVAQAELLVAVAAYYTLPSLLRGRAVDHAFH